jgi:hypothetical protein
MGFSNRFQFVFRFESPVPLRAKQRQIQTAGCGLVVKTADVWPDVSSTPIGRSTEKFGRKFKNLNRSGEARGDVKN